jgi:hypothetical protein
VSTSSSNAPQNITQARVPHSGIIFPESLLPVPDSLSLTMSRNNAGNTVTVAAAAGAIRLLISLLRNGTVQGKAAAAGALFNLAAIAGNQVTIAAAGGIPLLIALLRDGTAQGKTDVADALWNLAVNADNQGTIAAAGGIPLLIALLRDWTAEGKSKAAAALYNLAVNADNRVANVIQRTTKHHTGPCSSFRNHLSRIAVACS